MTKIAMLLAATALSTATPALADEASLQSEIALLKAQVAAQNQQLAAQAARLEQVEARLQTAPTVPAQLPVLADATNGTPGSPAPAALPVVAANSARTAFGAGSDTTIGGYGEIAYNGYVHDSSRNQADLKRFVLFFGHRFNDVRRQNIRHNSRRRLAECGPRLGVDVRRRACGVASADIRWSFV